MPGQVAWLDRPDTLADGSLVIANAGNAPLRVIVYTGERQNVPLVQHGPFIGETREDIIRSYERYQTGAFHRY